MNRDRSLWDKSVLCSKITDSNPTNIRTNGTIHKHRCHSPSDRSISAQNWDPQLFCTAGVLNGSDSETHHQIFPSGDVLWLDDVVLNNETIQNNNGRIVNGVQEVVGL